MNKPDVCFIGAGFHASTNIYPAAIKAGINIRAIATRSMENSKKALLSFGIEGRPYDDYIKMLEAEKCDGVIIVAQPQDQFSIALQCIKSGKNVFVEKPLGWTPDEARKVFEAALEYNALVMVGFMKRFAPCYKRLKDIIASKELGKARSFVMNFSVDSTPFCRNDEDFIKLAAIHIIDLIRFLFGEVSEINGFSNSIKENISQCLSFKFESGVVGSVYLCGMNAWSRESENITVTFDDGFLQAEEINKVIIHKNKKDMGLSFASHTEEDWVFTPSATPMSGTYRDLYLRGFVGEFEHFINCIKNKEVPLTNAMDNTLTMDLCERILQALK